MADIKAEKVDPKGDNKPKVDLGLLEEDDEFEEFPADGESIARSHKCKLFHYLPPVLYYLC